MAIALSLLCLTAGLAAGGPGNGDCIKIAVVNVPVVSEQYLKTGALEEQFNAERAKFTQDGNARRAEMEKLARSLEEELKPGSADYQQRREQLILQQSRLEAFVESEGAKLDASIARSLKAIFDDIQSMVSYVAAEKGIDLVLTIEPLPEGDPESSGVLRQQIMFQKVIYASPHIDITEEVVRRLNLEFKQSGAKMPAGAAPPDASDRGEADGSV